MWVVVIVVVKPPAKLPEHGAGVGQGTEARTKASARPDGTQLLDLQRDALLDAGVDEERISPSYNVAVTQCQIWVGYRKERHDSAPGELPCYPSATDSNRKSSTPPFLPPF